MSTPGEAAPTRGRRLTGGAAHRSYVCLAVLAIALAVGACRTYWPTLRGSAAAPAAETYRCAVEQVRALGYRPTAFNDGDRDMAARREDRAASARLPGERRQYDVLEIHAAPATGAREGAGSTLSVRAETIVRRSTREGWIEEGQPASPGVQTEARQIIERCAKQEAGTAGLQPRGHDQERRSLALLGQLRKLREAS